MCPWGINLAILKIYPLLIYYIFYKSAILEVYKYYRMTVNLLLYKYSKSICSQLNKIDM